MQSIDLPTLASNTSREIEDFSDYCRLCLQLPNECDLLDLQLVYDEEENLSYYDCFKICAQMDLRSGGAHTPHQLCKSCGLELQVAYDFYKKVEESKKFLLQLEKSASASTKETDLQLLEEITSDMEDKIKVETKLLIPVHVESEALANVADLKVDPADYSDVSIEYEELEEHVDVLEEYQAVEELVDEEIENDNAVNTIMMLEDEFIGIPEEINYDESTVQHSNIETSSQSLLPLAARPSDVDDIDLKEYIYENQDLPLKIEVSQQQQPDSSTQPSTSRSRRPGRVPLIPGGPPFQCEYCEHKSPTRTLLASHRFRKHRFKKPLHKCDKCDKEFSTKQQLERHKLRITCQSYPVFKCEFCDKSCTGRANYQIHLRFHKKLYPFVCHICAKPFMMAIHLNNHVKTKHEGQRFVCEYENCGKLFQTAHALKNHVYTHVEQLPYRCDYCQHEFSTKGRLRWHISRAHGIEHTLDELDCMLVGNEIKVKAQLRPVLPPNLEGQGKIMDDGLD